MGGMRAMRWTRDLGKDVAILRENNKRGKFINFTIFVSVVTFKKKETTFLFLKRILKA